MSVTVSLSSSLRNCHCHYHNDFKGFVGHLFVRILLNLLKRNKGNISYISIVMFYKLAVDVSKKK